ncbi:sensor histidine kinase [Lutibacter sp. B1]|uniref:sensor histidine kinase n=1 Tax=Lutibacter sp. B1 TaxID=2725996 RepID=UPI00145757C1|nr:sensor histidine kinase [Lutibacter sp. B1]NLP58542.1 histidine kinase [Lutibacter sp. B1]
MYIVVVIASILFFLLAVEELIPHPKIFPFLENMPHPTNEELNKFRKENFEFSTRMYFPTAIILLLLFTVSTSIKLGIEWYKIEKQKVVIESQKVNSELSFLKAQLNPHFLFNSLNSIYSLANKKSDQTTYAIVTLSELMRYMIYETNKEFISLQKEIDYIKNYILLQNLRLKDSSGVRFNVHGNLDHSIEPLLLISFIENAFKYGTDYTGKTDINIKIKVEKNILTLSVSNYISLNEKNDLNSGIGIHNIKSRLNLLYPNSHTLKIKEYDNLFEVELLLKLKK